MYRKLAEWSTVGLIALTFGSVSASAQIFTYSATLNGANESPSNLSPGTGTGLVTYNSVTHTLRVQSTFANLLGMTANNQPSGTTAAHIHCCTATPFTGTVGVATQTPSFSGFPLGVTFGTFDNTYDLTLATSFNGSFVTANGGTAAGAEAAFAAGLASGRTYLNIHTNAFGGGEIRGFLVTTVPEPTNVALTAAGLLALGTAARRRRTRSSV